MRIAFFGSSLVSSYWNGAATYYRGMLKELARLGHSIAFYEPDAYERQQHRDIPNPHWAQVIVYPANPDGWQSTLAHATRDADVIVKASGVGVFDRELEEAIPQACPSRALCIFWDVDAPATLDAITEDANHHLRRAIRRYDVVLTYGGGLPVIGAYERVGARACVPIYNALDPETHFPAPAQAGFTCDLGFLGNRLPDREARVKEFFLAPARLLPSHTFVLGGSGWHDKSLPPNVRRVGHVGTGEHNAFFCSGHATLNVNRESMARYGFSPPTRIFEAAGAGACLLTDRWAGIELFLEPGKEVIVADNADRIVHAIVELDSQKARRMAEAARARILAHHTYRQRAIQVDRLLNGLTAKGEAAE